ncbi:hypothetical protein fHeYen901_27 [Yersinia phage fHe-Yen9-01]|uniref:Anti-sigma factor n=1 Tax=Yersinia phage fHe-Yen9-01 TaxID=1965363 RepID=A0A1V0DXC5_9CAUD|nr:Srd anti-sigma factor [Yersinia phage fHe-Yen9-01]ARB05800.1 hypothetical protein fHeYen901_27 [Yersinia phage fHe-Yen9-01]
MSKYIPITAQFKLDRLTESAARRGKEMTLSLGHIENLIAQTHCAYSGEKFEYGKGQEYSSFERFNNDIGYVEGNVICVKSKYNRIRDSHNLDSLRDALKEAQLDLVLTKKGKVRKNKETSFCVKYRKIKNVLKVKKDIEKQLAKRIKAEKIMSAPNKKLSAQQKKDLCNIRLNIESYKIALTDTQLTCIKNSISIVPVNSEKIKALESKVHAYDILVRGLERLENLSLINLNSKRVYLLMLLFLN